MTRPHLPIRRRALLFSPTALLAVLGVHDEAAGAGQAEPLVVIVGSASPLREVSTAELRRLFSAEANTLRGRRAIPLNYPAYSEPRTRFDKSILRMSPSDAARYWIDRKIRGQRGAPKTVPASLIARVVQKLEHAVGYVPASAVTPGLRALLVDGHNAASKKYPLR